MELIWVILVSLVPGILWVWFFKRYDRRKPEPNSLLTLVFILGMLVVVPAANVETPFLRFMDERQNTLVQFAVFVLAVGLVEELAKLAVVYFACGRRREFDEVIDGIIYMVTAAFGFAAAENFFYMYSYGWEIGPIRAVISSLAHAVFSGLLGFRLGRVQTGLAPFSTLLSGLAGVSFFHGLYNFMLLNQNISSLYSLLMVAVLTWFLFYRIVQAKKLY